MTLTGFVRRRSARGTATVTRPSIDDFETCRCLRAAGGRPPFLVLTAARGSSPIPGGRRNA